MPKNNVFIYRHHLLINYSNLILNHKDSMHPEVLDSNLDTII
jgi:hypothetical protein